MLKRLDLHGVGPAPHLGPIDFADRLNLITGDNGLGKSFLLDVGWWALTGTWPDRSPWPREETTREQPPKLDAVVVGNKGNDSLVESRFNFDTRDWDLAAGRPPMPGLVLYFRVDGRFSLWDPAQHYWRQNKRKQVDDPTRPDALHLDVNDVWDALRSDDGKIICRGLIEDWVTWQQTDSDEFKLLRAVLHALSPDDREPLVPGEPLPPLALDPDDRRSQPTLAMPYGRVPVALASAGMKRILSLSYLLVWAWQGHKQAAAALRQQAERRLVILFDEPETHLHPQWQRRVLPSLLRAVEALGDIAVQVIASTHAPLVLASVETTFDAAIDKLFHFEASEGGPRVEEVPFAKRGDVARWLVSPIFGLEQGRSLEAEQAIEAAERFMTEGGTNNAPGLQTKDEIHARLLSVLGGSDPFWPRWLVKTGQA